MIKKIKNFIWFCRNWNRLNELYKSEHIENQKLYEENDKLEDQITKLIDENNELFNAKMDLECEFEQYRFIVSCSSDYRELIDTLTKYHVENDTR